MATSGSKTVAIFSSWINMKFSWWQNSQSVENNTTSIGWKLELITGNGAVYKSNRKWTVTIDGKTQTGTVNVSIDANSTQTLASGTATVNHKDDGTKTFSYSFSQQFDLTLNSGKYMGTYSGSGSDTLTTIARASQPSCITWPEHTQNVGEFGDEISIHMNRKSSSFTHTVRYKFGSQSGTIATGVETGTTWIIPMTLMNVIPNAIKGSGTIYVDTYKGNTKIGTKSCGFTATVPASVKPTCTLAVSDPTGHLATYGNYVKGLSKFKVTITPTLAYKSGIKTYNTTANGSKYTAASFTTDVLKSSGTLTISTTVTDNRGRSGSATKSLAVLNYTQPAVTKLTVGRCDSDGTANEQGDHVQVTFNATVTALNNKNTATYKVRYKKSTDTDYTSVTLTDLQDNYTVTSSVYIFPADTGSSYDVEVTVADNHGTATRSTSASTAFTLMHFGADGTSIGLMKVAEKSNAIDIGGDIYMNDNALYGSHGLFDNRDTNETPQYYMENHPCGVIWEFKRLTSIGFTSPSTTYAPVQTIIPWKDASGGLPRQVAYEGRTRWTRIATSETTWGAWQSDALIAYPVGSIYIAYNHTNPGTLFGGTWERLTGGFLWASQDGDTIGQTGGEKEHKLTVEELPAHSHGSVYSQHASGTKDKAWYNASGSSVAYGAVSTGGGKAHNNMPPYIQVSIWRRTA